MHRQRRRLHQHRRSDGRWLGRVGCVGAVAVVVVVGVIHDQPVPIRPSDPAGDRRVCAVIEAVVALMFAGVPPPIDGSPEEIRAVQQVNAQLAQRRETVMGLDIVKELGCG